MNTDSSSSSTSVSDMSKVCRFFAAGMVCKYGNECRFAHASAPMSVNAQQSDLGDAQAQQFQSEDRRAQSKSTCKFYFKNGWCSYGAGCRFSHDRSVRKQKSSGDNEVLVVNSENQPPVASKQTTVASKPAVQRQPEMPMRNLYPLSELTTPNDLSELRNVEIQQFKIRYRNAENVSEECYSFPFQPSDPDWPFDVRELQLLAWFASKYPAEVLKVTLADNDRLPTALKSHLEESMADWLTTRFDAQTARGMAELMLRPFLHWLDRNMQRLFTEGLKMYQRNLIAQSAGLEFVSADELKKQYNMSGSPAEESVLQNENEAAMSGITISDDGVANSKLEQQVVVRGDGSGVSVSSADKNTAAGEEEKRNVSPARKENSNTATSLDGAVQPVAKGTEVKLLGLNLGEGVATLTLKQACLVVQCSRCHLNAELTSVQSRQDVTATCAKCHARMGIKYSAAIAHQFSSVIGYLDLYDCGAFDLVLQNCEFLINCLGCSKDTALKGFSSGPPRVTWCHHCHLKMQLSAESVRFLNLQPSSVTVSRATQATFVKPVKDPAIQPGKPLPEFGACKHFKKSFRWFRFPCCGKAYPCDQCHDDNENDHEMVLATRMICGYCAKEQPFSGDKPCANCLADLTKRTTAFWEGGRGCRDKIKMARDDPKKYQDVNKTVSRKAQSAKSTDTKNTKPRHSS